MLDDEKWMWERDDDDSQHTLLSPEDYERKVMAAEVARPVRVIFQVLCVGAAWLLLSTLIAVGFELMLLGLLIFVSSRVRSWIELYSLKREMARELFGEYAE